MALITIVVEILILSTQAVLATLCALGMTAAHTVLGKMHRDLAFAIAWTSGALFLASMGYPGLSTIQSICAILALYRWWERQR